MHRTSLLKVAVGALVLAGVVVPAQRAAAAPVVLGAVALASEEPTPSADTGATGIVDLSVDGATGNICVQSTLSGLSGPLTAAHIHSGGAGTAGPVFVGLPVSGTSVSGCVAATPAQATAILAAPTAFYFNAHTAASPAGALRGQLTTSMFNATLSGANEVPPADAKGTGTAVVALDSGAQRACVVSTISGVDLPGSGSHIHSGVAGVAGPIVVPFSAPTTPTFGSCGPADNALISSIVASPAAFYFNVHNRAFPAGVIRGQLVARGGAGVPLQTVSAVVATIATSTTVAPTTVAPTTAAPTTTAPPTTAAATTTAAPTTTAPPTTAAPTTAASTTAPPASTAAPAESVSETPAVTG